MHAQSAHFCPAHVRVLPCLALVLRHAPIPLDHATGSYYAFDVCSALWQASELDAPNEFFLDEDADTLYYIPAEGTSSHLSAHRICISTFLPPFSFHEIFSVPSCFLSYK